MITNYYTLMALADHWKAALNGCIVGDVYSQSKDELIVALANPQTTWLLRASVRTPFQYIFRTEGYNKARRNVATLFKPAFDASVTDIRLAERDRVLWIELSNGLRLQYSLFGSRANVLLIDSSGIVVEAFQRGEALQGNPASQPSPAPSIDTYEDFLARWPGDAPMVTRAMTRAHPFFNAALAQEAVIRSGIRKASPGELTEIELDRLFAAAQSLEQELSTPIPRIYWDGERAEKFALVELTEYSTLRSESFDDVDRGITVYVRKKLGQAAFDSVFVPLEKALSTASSRAGRQLDAMLEALAEQSRADRYERWGHLLMASQNRVPTNAKSVDLEDLFDENRPVTIPLDPNLSGIENAERYYEKARQTRLSREHAEQRLIQTEEKANESKNLLEALRALKTRSEVIQFQKDQTDRLAPFLGQKNEDRIKRIPFRRYDLGNGYEVWVGKNAKQNDRLTFEYARKFDLWLHARGVSGSHTVLRRPNRTAQPDKSVLERAASIAAYHSKARGSQLVPVIVTEKKYVRKPRGAAVGTVLVEREQVLLVEPGID